MWLAEETYGLCDVVDDDGAVCVAVVHGCERLVALLAGGIPDLELDRRVLIEGDGLGEEGGADGGFPVVVELVLGVLVLGSCRGHVIWRTLTKRNTRDDCGMLAYVMAALIGLRTFPTADSPEDVSHVLIHMW